MIKNKTPNGNHATHIILAKSACIMLFFYDSSQKMICLVSVLNRACHSVKKHETSCMFFFLSHFYFLMLKVKAQIQYCKCALLHSILITTNLSNPVLVFRKIVSQANVSGSVQVNK